MATFLSLTDTNGDECAIRGDQIVKVKRVIPQTGKSEGVPCLVVSCKISEHHWDETWLLDIPENREALGMRPYVSRRASPGCESR